MKMHTSLVWGAILTIAWISLAAASSHAQAPKDDLQLTHDELEELRRLLGEHVAALSGEEVTLGIKVESLGVATSVARTTVQSAPNSAYFAAEFSTYIGRVETRAGSFGKEVRNSRKVLEFLKQAEAEGKIRRSTLTLQHDETLTRMQISLEKAQEAIRKARRESQVINAELPKDPQPIRIVGDGRVQGLEMTDKYLPGQKDLDKAGFGTAMRGYLTFVNHDRQAEHACTVDLQQVGGSGKIMPASQKLEIRVAPGDIKTVEFNITFTEAGDVTYGVKYTDIK